MLLPKNAKASKEDICVYLHKLKLDENYYQIGTTKVCETFCKPLRNTDVRCKIEGSSFTCYSLLHFVFKLAGVSSCLFGFLSAGEVWFSCKCSYAHFSAHGDTSSRDSWLMNFSLTEQVFMKEAERQVLQDTLHKEVIRKIVLLQSWLRMVLERRRFLRTRQAAVVLQVSSRITGLVFLKPNKAGLEVVLRFCHLFRCSCSYCKQLQKMLVLKYGDFTFI